MKYYLFKTSNEIRVNFVENDVIVKRRAWYNYGDKLKHQPDAEEQYIGIDINDYITEVSKDKPVGVIREITEVEAFEILL